ncbi:nucleoporin-62 C-terminal [Sigmodon hispidus]
MKVILTPTFYALILGSTAVATTDNSSTMFPVMPNAPALMASQEPSSPKVTTSTSTTTTITTNTTTTITSGFNLYFKPPALPWGSDGGLINVASLPVTMTVNTIFLSIVTPVMTYCQMDNVVDKWNFQVQEQERQYLYHANQVNVWNHTMIEGRDEIIFLHNEVERVKMDQFRLERELDFILTQQKELEHLLNPLEEFMKEQNGPLLLLNMDKDYEKIYQLAENIDAELKKMSQDLKDIIAHLNSLKSSHNNPEVLQEICTVLNGHMESLQWIRQTSSIMHKKVEEVTKAFEEYRRKQQEYNMKIAFE